MKVEGKDVGLESVCEAETQWGVRSRFAEGLCRDNFRRSIQGVQYFRARNQWVVYIAFSTYFFQGVSGPLLQMKTRVERTLNPKTGQLELDANVSRLAKEKNNQERKKAKMKTTQEISLSDGRDKRHALLSTAMQKRRVILIRKIAFYMCV